MSKRIFTKVFTNTLGAPTGDTAYNAFESWLVQYEAIEVIGVQASVWSVAPSENDGFATCDVEVSQVGVIAQEGAILSVHAGEGWNTTPAGICREQGQLAVTFPGGFAVPVKEEGYIYINGKTVGKSAGASTFDYEVVVYYTKKGSR